MENKYRNLFKDKTEDELRVLYKQFLIFEKESVIPQKSELCVIRDEYKKWFSNPISMIQYDLLHTISDLWLNNQ